MKVPHAKTPPERPTAAATPDKAAGPHVPAARFRQRAFRAGFTQVPNVVLTSARLDPVAKLAYVALCQFAWQDDKAWPTQNALAASVNASGRTLRRALKQLTLLGLLTVERKGAMAPNVYWLEPLDTFAEEEAEWAGEPVEKTPAPAPSDRTKTTHHDAAHLSGHDAAHLSGHDAAHSSGHLHLSNKTQDEEDTHRVCAVADAPSPGLACARLNDAGLSKPVAKRLVERHGAAVCQQQLAWLPLRKARDPAATLRRAIEEAWLPPDGNPKLRLPGEKPYVPLAPPVLPEVGPESDAARLQAKAALALRGLASSPPPAPALSERSSHE